MPFLWLGFLLSSTFLIHVLADEHHSSNVYPYDMENFMEDPEQHYKLVSFLVVFSFVLSELVQVANY